MAARSPRWGGGLRTPLLDLHGTLRRQLAPGLADCEARLGAPAAGHLTIETTVDEVVDVQARATSAAMGACLTEVAWALRLDEGFRFVSGHVWAVDLDGQAASPR